MAGVDPVIWRNVRWKYSRLLNPKMYCSRNCTAISPVPAAIIHRARAKQLRWVDRLGTHAISITDNIIIVSMPLICISPIVIMTAKV